MSMEVLGAVVEAATLSLLRQARRRAALELPNHIRETAVMVEYLRGRALFAQLSTPVPLDEIARVLRHWADQQDRHNRTEPFAVATGGYL